MLKIINLISLWLLIIATIAAAQERPFIDEPTTSRPVAEDDKPWAEDAGVKLPAYPQDSDLVEFAVDDPDKNFRYFIDAKSLTIGKVDQVVRYTLVIQSATGVRNISFEGMRCESREYKIYAVGTATGHLQALTGSQWTTIKRSDPYRHHVDLREFYLCPPDLRSEPYSTSEILHRLGTITSSSDTELL